MKDSYLSKFIEGKFGQNQENRLTKIFCASFNHSPKFQKLFLRFIGFRTNGKLVASDQLYKKSKQGNIIDVFITKPDKRGNPSSKRLIAIENKVNSPLTNAQLKRYERVSDVRNLNRKYRIALVKNYFDSYNYRWQIKHWSEFYYRIKTSATYSKLPSQSIDKFILNNFLRYLKSNNMDTVTSIIKKDLDTISKIFDITHKLEDRKGVFISLRKSQPFETATNFINMLECLIAKAKESKIIRSRTKNFQFNPRIKGSWYYSGDKQKKMFPCIVAKISLKKTFGNIRSLETGLYFERNKASINSRVVSVRGYYSGEKRFTGKILYFDKYCKETIEFWERKLKVTPQWT